MRRALLFIGLLTGVVSSQGQVQGQGRGVIKSRGRGLRLRSGPSKRGLLVIPGVGRSDRLRTLVSSLKLLERNYLTGPRRSWDCVVYIYAPPSDVSFWGMKEELGYVNSLCSTVEHTNKRVTENLYMVQPALIKNVYSHVFVLLDDCKLLPDPDSVVPGSEPAFNLQRMLDIMEHNNLTLASPRVLGANVGGGQAFRTLMQAKPQPGTEGYSAIFVEWFAWLLTIRAYEAFWELLCPHVQPYGWGYDFWYDSYAKTRVPGHKMGIISTIEVKHEQDTTVPGSGRTETANVETKWSAVQKQEKHYKEHLGVDLKTIRQSLKLQNTSWNGAVTGFLRSAPEGTGARARLPRAARGSAID